METMLDLNTILENTKETISLVFSNQNMYETKENQNPGFGSIFQLSSIKNLFIYKSKTSAKSCNCSVIQFAKRSSVYSVQWQTASLNI